MNNQGQLLPAPQMQAQHQMQLAMYPGVNANIGMSKPSAEGDVFHPVNPLDPANLKRVVNTKKQTITNNNGDEVTKTRTDEVNYKSNQDQQLARE